MVIASVFGEDEGIYKQIVAGQIGRSEQRPPHSYKRFFLHFTQGVKEFVAGFAQDSTFGQLEVHATLAYQHCAWIVSLPRSFVTLEPRTKPLKSVPVLFGQLRAQELDNGYAREQVERSVPFRLGAVQSAYLQFGEPFLVLGCIDRG